jgi:hypothetical protein
MGKWCLLDAAVDFDVVLFDSHVPGLQWNNKVKAFWSHNRIVQHLLAVVAVAVQKGNATTVLRWHQDATVRASVVEE